MTTTQMEVGTRYRVRDNQTTRHDNTIRPFIGRTVTMLPDNDSTRMASTLLMTVRNSIGRERMEAEGFEWEDSYHRFETDDTPPKKITLLASEVEALEATTTEG